MTKDSWPKDFLKLLHCVKAKRPRTVIEHILKHGQITTQELKDIYGYNHPPRAIRDVREQGIPIITFRVVGSDGRKIAAYKFGDPAEVRSAQLSGRTVFSATLKSILIDKYGSRCNIYLEDFPERELQIDHRIPFEIAGDNAQLSKNSDEYMLLCGSANRAKSWSCENCRNWKLKKTETCQSCYWAFPENYIHIALRDIRRLEIMWTEKQTAEYDRLKAESEKVGKELPDYVKRVIRNHFKQKNGS